jgi:hypothetical protein
MFLMSKLFTSTAHIAGVSTEDGTGTDTSSLVEEMGETEAVILVLTGMLV